MAELFGRNRESVADIEHELHQLFLKNPQVYLDENGIPRLPTSAIPFIFREWADIHGSEDLLTEDELNTFLGLLESQSQDPEPKTLLGVIAVRGKDLPHFEPEAQDRESLSGSQSPRASYSRSSSRDSRRNSGGSVVGTRSPVNEAPESPFEAKSRQRSRPLVKDVVPSSWNSKRPLPASHSRRKSDAGYTSHALSDSESSPYSTPSDRKTRTRAPSNPTSPTPSSTLVSPTVHSPYSSRPPSRSQSVNGYYHSPRNEEAQHHHHMSPTSFDSMQPMSLFMPPRGNDSDSDEEGREHTARLSRLATASPTSLVAEDHVESLIRANEDLKRKLVEAEQTLTKKLQDSDEELAELEVRIEELKQELAAKNREEKELRSKDRATMTQIQALEAEVSKLERLLENSRTAYQSLHRQYQEQCAESEKYRNTIRSKDEELKELMHFIERSNNEEEKRDQGRLATELRVSQLEEELVAMREAEGNLDLQKAENLLLKETIDRLRFELDELTNAAATGSVPGPSSNVGTISKSWGAEVARVMQGQLASDGQDEDGAPDEGGESTEGEEEIQTIITRKRKVPGRGNKHAEVLEETTKEYHDAYVQHDSPQAVKTQFTPDDPALASAVPEKGSYNIHANIDSKLGSQGMISVDLPPSYTLIDDTAPGSSAAQQERAELAMDTLKRWHRSHRPPFDPVPGGVSQETVDEWEFVKKELGIDCLVIDQVVEASQKRAQQSRFKPPKRGRDNRFYNIYNTYIYGTGGLPLSATVPPLVTVLGVVAVLLVVQPFMPTAYNTPGTPSYFDRICWAGAHSIRPAGEGFEDSQTPALFSIIGRLMVGSAQIAANRLRPAFSPT